MNSGIRKRGNSYAVSVSVKGLRKTSSAPTYEDAIRMQAQLRANMLSVTPDVKPPQATCWTLGHATTQCEQIIWKGTRNESNSVQNANSARQFFGDETLLDAISTTWSDGYIARLKQLGNSNGTINRKLAALSRIMSFARENDMMSKAPKLRRQREIGGRIRFFTIEEEAHILTTFSGWEYDCQAEAVCVLADTGMRTGELWRLSSR